MGDATPSCRCRGKKAGEIRRRSIKSPMILELIVCCLARLNDTSYNLPEECLELFRGTPTHPRARREQVWVANLNLNLRRPGGRGGTGATREGRCPSPSSRHPGAIHGPPAPPGAEHLPPAPTGQFVARPPIPGQFIDHPPLWGHTDAPPPPPPWGNSSSPGASRGRTSTTRARGALRHPPAPVGENNARPSPAGKIVDRAPPSRRAEHRHPVARGVRRPPGARCSSTAFHGLLILTNWFLVLFLLFLLSSTNGILLKRRTYLYFLKKVPECSNVTSPLFLESGIRGFSQNSQVFSPPL